MEVSRRENALFLHKWGVCEEKTCLFHLNGGFAKRKCEIFAEMGDLRGENASFSHKWGILEGKTRDFLVKWGICE